MQAPELNIKKQDVLKQKKQLRFRQRMLVKYLVAGIPIEEIADKLNVSLSRCKAWVKRNDVIEFLDQQTALHADLDSKKRKKRSEFIVSEIYDVIVDKISEGSLNRMNVKNLMKFFVEMNKEVRIDTPGDSTQKIDHRVKLELSEELSQRYRNANSSNFDNKDNKIIDINLPTKSISSDIILPIQSQLVSGEKNEKIISKEKERSGNDRRKKFKFKQNG